MSRDIWVIGCIHYNHANMINFKDKDGNPARPFKTVQEMNETLLENWNSVVKPGDKTYDLGDTFFGDPVFFKKMWPKFNGSKNLIVGNHTDIKFMSTGGFYKKVYMWRSLPELGILMTHVPVHESQLWDFKRNRQMRNVHAHVHLNSIDDDRYVNVCAEKINYTPINIEELRIY